MPQNGLIYLTFLEECNIPASEKFYFLSKSNMSCSLTLKCLNGFLKTSEIEIRKRSSENFICPVFKNSKKPYYNPNEKCNFDKDGRIFVENSECLLNETNKTIILDYNCRSFSKINIYCNNFKHAEPLLFVKEKI